ncbi:hypothetical protein BGZ80_005617 [Entomortierella chlamydospora]|uniref:MYND-type domain-containing protein n=1 Tax=Entomortierella chlamydospora TaxID=101097 RepID=A0A9P6MK71_9FUNG|nr:hypothetical protein BGZ79_004193 [Entomortierella chlamydospora]KAG0004423.1 hypothetical protein BGZ80_005617 [Entomortierella chlamydospora]
MREPNFSFPNQNRAAICITSSIYDRRALDCTDYIPIINTLTNLAYLTGSTPTIREFITRDGGLERLVTILKTTKVNDRKNGLKWTLAFQCVVNIGVRGTEHIRKRVVQAGMVPVIVHVLESFFTVLKSVNDENERRKLLRRAETAQQNSQTMITDGDHSTDSQPFTAPMTEEPEQLQGTGLDTSNNSSSSLSSSSITAATLAAPSTTAASITVGSVEPSTVNLAPQPTTIFQNSLFHHNPLDDAQGPSAMPAAQELSQAHTNPDNTRSIPMDNGDGRPQQIFYREDDILHSLQLLAYLSKYPSLRSSFHTDSGSNVFAIVEKFTHRTMHPMEIQYWAGVIMRNACRKDDSRKGIRQCAYTGCGKWETKPREFAKCRRCRKAKYCSKQCQSKAWNEGHRWWCIEKKPESMGVSTSFGTDLPPAPPPPPPPPADLQDQPEATPNIMENGGISMATGAGARMIGGGQGGNSTGHHVHRVQQPNQHQHQDQGHLYYQLGHRPLSSTPNPQAQLSAQAAASSLPSTQVVPQDSQQHLLQRQQLILPQQPQTSQIPYHATQQQQQQQQLRQQSVSEHSTQDRQVLQQIQMQQQQHRHLQAMQQQQRLPQMRPAPIPSSSPRPMVPTPQRSMSQSHPSTAPIRASSRTELTPHLGISPDSPTPEQLAQRFVQQAALYPGQHNELAQSLHAQFQQFFPPHHQAEAKRQFSFHARELFARHQRQQELLRNGGLGSSLNPNGRSTPYSAPITTSGSGSSSLSRSNSHMETSKQGTPRRRSDLDSDEEYPSNTHSNSHMTSTSFSVPMLTQDLSTTMSLSSMELSGPPPTSIMDGRLSTEPNSIPCATDEAKADQTSVRDFKVRKLMSREESSNHEGGSSSGIANREPVQRGDGWSYSRHMAKDASVDP